MADDQENPTVLGWGYIIYQQIAGVVGAFALIAFLAHFVHVDWRGALADLVSAWNSSVRPAISLTLEILIAWPLEWLFNFHLPIPLSVRDYCAVGAVVFASNFRTAVGLQHQAKLPRLVQLYDYRRGIPGWLALFVVCLVAWPLTVSASLEIASTRTNRRGVAWDPSFRRAVTLSLSPILYFAALLLVNSFL
jgi:hypothetical protein